MQNFWNIVKANTEMLTYYKTRDYTVLIITDFISMYYIQK